MLALKSSHFEGKIKYPRRSHSNICSFHKIAFKTDEAEEDERSKKSYQERMIRCEAHVRDHEGYTNFYISRGYQPGQVFLYVSGPPNEVHLENLSANIGIVHEPYNFGDVEI